MLVSMRLRTWISQAHSGKSRNLVSRLVHSDSKIANLSAPIVGVVCEPVVERMQLARDLALLVCDGLSGETHVL
jgi:hypothetical protein